ncbi:MAG: hypothetical protein CMH56_04155 [Myxococcales bacterium]|nr:hypothetical protein [Myxococcales bacterium]
MTSPAPTSLSPLTPSFVLKTGAVLLLGLWVGKELLAINEIVGQLLLTLTIAFQLYVPYVLYQRAGLDPEQEGLHVHGLILGPIASLRRIVVNGRRRKKLWAMLFIKPIRQWLASHGRHAQFRPTPFLRDFKRALFFMGITFPPFAVGHHYFQLYMAKQEMVFELQMPPDFLAFIVFQILLVALPEELFYRGFMLGALLRWWPNERTICGIPVGKAVLVSSIYFALAHFVGEYNILRLGPFFPAFLFAYLRMRGASIFGAITFHACSNIFSQILFVGYHAQ